MRENNNSKNSEIRPSFCSIKKNIRKNKKNSNNKNNFSNNNNKIKIKVIYKTNKTGFKFVANGMIQIQVLITRI